MAELASGAVSSLLGVIRNEWQVLDRVGSDVQFIREEMESMNSFLLHLTRTAAATGPRAGAGGEHDEQVRTWMNQVRVLAQDCNNCIDLYLYRGNRDIHLGKEPLLRCLRWLPWFLRKTLAQHRAAMELAVLKERARDVGKRRLRYGVEVPKKGAAAAAAEGGGEAAAFVDLDDDGQDQDWHDQAGTRTGDGSGGLRVTRALFGIYSVEDYLNDKLGDWIRLHQEHRDQRNTPCIAVVVPDTEKDSGAVARDALAAADKHGVKNTILVDISAMHLYSELGPKNTLYYILRVLQGQGTGQGKEGEGVLKRLRRKRKIRHEKRKVIGAIKENIAKMKVTDKVEEMKKQIDQVKDSQLQPYGLSGTPREVKEEEDDNDKNMEKKISGEQSLALLLVLLLRSSAADETNKKDMSRSIHTKFYDHIMKTAAKKLKEHMKQVNQEGGANQKIILKTARYEDILQEVFPKTNKRQQAQEQDTEQGATSAVTLGQDQIKEIVDKVKQEALREVFKAILQQDQVEKMIDKAKQEILQQVSQDKSNKEQPTGVPAGGQGSTAEALTEETNEKGQQATGEQKTVELLDSIKKTIEKIRYMRQKIERQLVMAGIVDKIKEHLDRAKATLIILKIDDKYVDEWDKIRNALSMLPNIAVVMILAKTEDIQTRAKQYCHPIEKPINYSLAALYHEIVLEITSQQKNEDNCDPQIFSTILDKCGPHELCWKIFAHTLYAKPRRSKEELHKLYNSLEAVPTKSFRDIALKMFKFSYRDMSKEYQSCLLYLAIFPRGYKIRRSTLIGRWVAEGLITTDDWRWSSSVEKAEHCFEELFARWFVYSADISATGRVKSCKVGDLVHDFITEIAKKQRIVETRLSYHLARYFSIFNEIHLRGSDKIEDFLERLSESSQWSRLKVLDLEGCQCFWKNRSYLKNICKIMLLKYLSLRGTDVNWLPTEINNLRELEVLDIRQTHVPMIATENIILLKLKRLLAGHTNPSPSSTTETGISFPNHVLVPGKIEKMLEMEVLSNVKAKSNQDLQDIGKLWRLRKLGVVIDDKVSRFNNLLQAISNLHECLRSLSITLEIVRKSTSSIIPLKEPNKYLKDSPKILESLSIRGTIQPELQDQLLYLLCTHLTKVTLSYNTLPVNMEALSELPILYCLRLRYNAYANNKLVFNPSGFKKLKYFLVEGFNEIDEIRFEDRAVPELEKIVLSFTNMEPITFAGVDQLPNLKELELNNTNKSSNKTSCITAIADHSPDSEATATAAAAAAATAIDSDTSTALHPTLPATAAASTDLALSSPAVAAAQGPNPVAIATDPAPLAAAATDAGTNSPPSASTANNTMPFSKLLGIAKQIAKVTLRGTMLKQGDLRFLAKTANIRCLELLDESCDESHLAFKKDEFPKLNALIVNCSRITDIKFKSRACPKLEKIVWTFTKMKYFSGINNLLRLKELEFNGDSPLPNQVKEAIDKHKDKIHCTYYKQEIQEKTLGNTEEKLHGAPCCPLILKGKRWHWTSS